MEDYSLGLALFDYLPVAISALGMYWLAGMITQALPERRALLLLGVVLIAAGGLSKASWKLLWVLSATDYSLLNNLLFILMAPGFLVLACHLRQARLIWRGSDPGIDPLGLALPLIGLAWGASLLAAWTQPGSKTWFFLLLGTVSIASITIHCWLIALSWRLQQKLTAGLFLLAIVLTLSLSGLARVSPGVAVLQWVAEILNTLAHATTAYAVWRLRPVIPKTPGRV